VLTVSVVIRRGDRECCLVERFTHSVPAGGLRAVLSARLRAVLAVWRGMDAIKERR